ncbi:cupredoxin domain-containing protein [Candidatus Roizmanbacteria bacterium]|nr:cupredoxin domain-containing protein [Candidatus Roizmanbacteria bacterium]
MEETTKKGSAGYGKKPLWQWVIIYVIIGTILYGAVYYFFFSKKGGYNYTSPTQAIQESQNKVTLSIDGFSPETLSIKAGTKVTWINKSGSVASINSAVHPTHLVYPSLNLGEVQDGASVSLTFDKPGTYKYHNHLNPSQKGTIVAQ